MGNPEEAGATPTISHFREQVRDALEHLYDTDVLADHWLTHQLRLAHLPTGSHLMRQTLIESIQNMRPTQGEPPGSQRWQMHQILLQRYVQQIGAIAVADQLVISERTLRRLQSRALAQLAELLLTQIQQLEEGTPLPSAEEASLKSATPNQWIKTVDAEIGWMRTTSLSEAVDAGTLLAEALQIIAPLQQSTHTRIENHCPATLPEISIHPSGLRQVYLSVLNHAVKDAANGRVELSASSDEAQLTITMRIYPAQGRSAMALPEPQLLVARRILSVFGGQIEQRQEADGSPSLQIRLMVAGGTSVLAIDDNTDVLQLFERYVLGTRYRLTLCQKAEAALQMAIEVQPRIIIMDIMMPGLDGWSLLGQLCHHPATSSIPVIISTIVAERDLALTLGAVGFVQKPVRRGEFLDALTHAAERAAPTPR